MKKRIQVTINAKLVADAKKMMAVRGFDSFSEFLESLIRDEADRRALPGFTAPAGNVGRATTELNDPKPTYRAK